MRINLWVPHALNGGWIWFSRARTCAAIKLATSATNIGFGGPSSDLAAISKFRLGHGNGGPDMSDDWADKFAKLHLPCFCASDESKERSEESRIHMDHCPAYFRARFIEELRAAYARGAGEWRLIEELPDDFDRPSGSRYWLMLEINGNVVKGKRTLWNNTGYIEAKSGREITPVMFRPLPATPERSE